MRQILQAMTAGFTRRILRLFLTYRGKKMKENCDRDSEDGTVHSGKDGKWQ